MEHIVFVCVRNAITNRKIKETVATGAVAMNDLQAQLGVATCYGCCGELATSFLNGAGTQVQGSVTAGINVQCRF